MHRTTSSMKISEITQSMATNAFSQFNFSLIENAFGHQVLVETYKHWLSSGKSKTVKKCVSGSDIDKVYPVVLPSR